MSAPVITGKTVRVGTKSFSAMFAELRELHSGGHDTTPPDGAFNADQYAEANGVAYDAAYSSCNRLCRAGKLKKHIVRDASCGRSRLRAYFVRVS